MAESDEMKGKKICMWKQGKDTIIGGKPGIPGGMAGIPGGMAAGTALVGARGLGFFFNSAKWAFPCPFP